MNEQKTRKTRRKKLGKKKLYYLVRDLGEGRRARAHQHLADPVLERFEPLVVHPQVRLRRALLGHLVLQGPHAVLVPDGGVASAVCVPDAADARADLAHPALGQDPHLEAAHREQQVGVVPRVDRHEGVGPLERGQRAREAVADVPEGGAAEVDVVLHQAHARVARPALFVVVADDVLVVWVLKCVFFCCWWCWKEKKREKSEFFPLFLKRFSPPPTPLFSLSLISSQKKKSKNSPGAPSGTAPPGPSPRPPTASAACALS